VRRAVLAGLAWFLLASWTLIPFLCVFSMAWSGQRSGQKFVVDGPNERASAGLKWLRSSDGTDVRNAIRNSLAVATITALVVVAVGVPAGYVLGALWGVRGTSLSGLVVGRAVPSGAILMPILNFCLALKITGSLWLLVVLHSALVSPLLVALVARQPWDRIRLVEQAAYLDGAGTLRVRGRLWTVFLLPTIAFGLIIAWLESWKEFGFAVMLMGGDSATLPVILSRFESVRGVDWGRFATTLLIAVLPSIFVALCITALARRYFTPSGATRTW
jgi:multiple sugar transport system permease protein